MTIQIRASKSDELGVIQGVVRLAFGTDGVCCGEGAPDGRGEGELLAGLIEDLMGDASARPVVSLVAEAEGEVVGHVLFTRVVIGGEGQEEGGVSASIMAPLAVLPGHQDRGVGGRLIADGLEVLRGMGVGLVFVLGDPAYYGRFGFGPAGIKGLSAEHPVPVAYADAWMVQELRAGVLGRVHGRVRVAESLRDKKYWLG